MYLVAGPPPEERRVVAFEVMDRLAGIDLRGVVVPRDVADAWAEVRRCDEAVLVVLDRRHREHLQAIIDTRRPRVRPSRWSGRTPLHAEIACLRVAVHRRLMVLQHVVSEAVVHEG
jgi:hypothetical protein